MKDSMSATGERNMLEWIEKMHENTLASEFYAPSIMKVSLCKQTFANTHSHTYKHAL